MAEVLYQRSEPRHKDWLPLLSQQIRLRNITQLILVNGSWRDGGSAYFTLHTSPLSAPFYTSPRTALQPVTVWPEIQPSLCQTRLSATGCVVRVWSEGRSKSLISWAVVFQGLYPVFPTNGEEWSPSGFCQDTLLFATPFGAFTAMECVIPPPINPQKFVQFTLPTSEGPPRPSYTLKNLVALHRLQRSVLEEHDLCDKYRMEIGVNGYGIDSREDKMVKNPLLTSERLIHRAKIGRRRNILKEEIESVKIKVKCLLEEKGRAEGRIRRLKKDSVHFEEMKDNLIKGKVDLTPEKAKILETKATFASKGQILGKCRNGVFLRKKQLISELLQIYPLTLVEGSKRYSINGVQLPNAEEYGNEGGGQISVALGYTAHLIAMLAFFLDIPCRYPIRHLGSRSRITDHITVQIPDREREFPLYFKGKKDVYCSYAVYLLNKNIAQLRWYCGLSTPDLRASLPNLVELLTSRLVIPGWPPNLGEMLEIAQEITEEADSEFLEGDVSKSLDGGLDNLLSNEDEDAYSKDEIPGVNSAALGDVPHGRGQDKFLSGWKKKTYIETDDFDPKWLLDSMNLDFDTGRRFSIPRSSPPPKPMILVSDEPHQSRRRRFGQVEPPILHEGSESVNPHPNKTPAQNMIQLEQDIREYERRKSRGTAGSPTHQPREQRVVNTNVFPSSYGNLLVPPPSEDNWITDEEKVSESNGNGSHDRDAEIDKLQVKHSEVCSTGYHVPLPVSPLPVENPTQLLIPHASIEDTSNQESQILKAQDQEPQEISTPTDSKSASCDVPDNDVKDCDSSRSRSTDCEASLKSGIDTVSSAIDSSAATDSSLWMRTEALLGSQSFNLVRRRLSTSESTT